MIVEVLEECAKEAIKFNTGEAMVHGTINRTRRLIQWIIAWALKPHLTADLERINAELEKTKKRLEAIELAHSNHTHGRKGKTR